MVSTRARLPSLPGMVPIDGRRTARHGPRSARRHRARSRPDPLRALVAPATWLGAAHLLLDGVARAPYTIVLVPSGW